MPALHAKTARTRGTLTGHRRRRRPHRGVWRQRFAIRRSQVVLDRRWSSPLGDRDRNRAQVEKSGSGETRFVAIAKLVERGPSFRVTTDQESGQTILKGGEIDSRHQGRHPQTHLKVDAISARRRWSYREKISKHVPSTIPLQEATAGPGVRCSDSFAEPMPHGAGSCLKNQIIGVYVPQEVTFPESRGTRIRLGSGCWRVSPASTSKVGADRRRLSDVESYALAFEIFARGRRCAEALAKGLAQSVERS